MNWLAAVGAIAQVVLIVLKEWSARRREDDEAVREIQKHRLAVWESIRDRDSGKLSQMASDRATRLRIILDGVRKEGPPIG